MCVNIIVATFQKLLSPNIELVGLTLHLFFILCKVTQNIIGVSTLKAEREIAAEAGDNARLLYNQFSLVFIREDH